MKPLKSYLSRRKFTFLGLGVLSSFTVFRFFAPANDKGNKKMVRMLAQDGTLVEVDTSLLTAGKRKVSTEEVQHWIKK